MDEKMVGCSNKIILAASLIDFNRSGQLTTDENMALSLEKRSTLKVLNSSRTIQTTLLNLISWNFCRQPWTDRNTTTIMTIVSNVSMLLPFMLLPFTTTTYYIHEGLEWH